MRKADREITDFEQIVKVLRDCDTVRLGIFGEEYPYVVPVSFGLEVADGKIVIYFHGAGEGLKHDLLRKNPKVCVEADLLRGYCGHGMGVTADYKSVIGFGTAQKVEELEERVKGLQLLLEHCKTEGYSARECALRPITVVYKIVLEKVTGKQRFEA